jgi:DNA/RNA endonuclease YhcR with UshA esterase domain
MRIYLSVIFALLIQLPGFSFNNLDLQAENLVQLISHTSQYVRVTGTISSIDISEKSKIIFINFGKNYNTSFSAMIHDEDMSSFIAAGIDDPSEYFKNKTVSVEGIVRISNGKPEMIINSPDQIKIVNLK